MYRMRELSWRIGRSPAGTEPTVAWAATRWSATAAGSSRGRPASAEQSRSGPRWVQVQRGAAPHQTQAPAPIHRRVCAESERGGGRRRRKGGRHRTEYGKRRACERPIASPCAASHNGDAPPQLDVYAAGFPEGPTRGRGKRANYRPDSPYRRPPTLGTTSHAQRGWASSEREMYQPR